MADPASLSSQHSLTTSMQAVPSKSSRSPASTGSPTFGAGLRMAFWPMRCPSTSQSDVILRHGTDALCVARGLGKTVQTCAIMSLLHHEMQQFGPFLIVVPLSTLPAWQVQINQWAPDLNLITYIGNAASREIIRECEFGSPKKLKFNVLLTTYEFILKDRAHLSNIKWHYLAVDEVGTASVV